MVSFDDFKKLDIRIGTVVSAERIPDTDKLLKLIVDMGEGEPRQIIAGIAEYIAPEDLAGTQCPFVANLEPRRIKGYESQGMLMAIGAPAGHGPSLVLLRPAQEVPPGSAIQ